MKYLALDQALKLTGYAYYENKELKSWGTLETNATYNLEVRLGTLWKHLNILHEKFEFEHIFFEDVQKQVNQDTYKRLCYVQAAIMLWCYYNDMKYTILSPSHWRKVIKDKHGISFGRKREEQKAAARQFVQDYFSLSLGEDEADAVCLGLAGIEEYNYNRSAF